MVIVTILYMGIAHFNIKKYEKNSSLFTACPSHPGYSIG
jgi:hypothetical protein